MEDTNKSEIKIGDVIKVKESEKKLLDSLKEKMENFDQIIYTSGERKIRVLKEFWNYLYCCHPELKEFEIEFFHLGGEIHVKGRKGSFFGSFLKKD